MFTVSVKDDLKRAIGKLSVLQSRQFPFVISKAINTTAKQSQGDLRTAMTGALNNPKPYTLNSTFVRYSNKQNLTAVVTFKDRAGSGTPAGKYLAPLIFGQQRRVKRFERLLTGRGIIPNGSVAVPGAAAQLDGYGNIKRSQLTAIIRQVKPEASRPVSKRTGKRAQNGYFAGSPAGGRLPDGIWRRDGRNIKPVLIFVDSASYTPQFDFSGIVHRTVRRDFAKHLQDAIQYAIATSR